MIKIKKTKRYSDVIIGAMASQITILTIAYSTVYSGADQRKYQSSASLAFVRGIHRWPVNSPHKWPVTWKMFYDVIMRPQDCIEIYCHCVYYCARGSDIDGFLGGLSWAHKPLSRYVITGKNYRKISNIRRTKSKNLNTSRLRLESSLCSILKSVVKSRMKM